MRYKTLVAVAVAGAFGLSASAFAGPNTGPVSVNENTPWLSQHFFPLSSSELGTHGYSSEAGGMVIIEQLSTVEPAVLTEEDTLALADLGIYSDFYRVSFTPIAVDRWDHYVLSPVSGGEYAAAEFYVFTPGDVVYMLDFSSAELSPDELASLSDTDWMAYIDV